jgi:hypothetical protein
VPAAWDGKLTGAQVRPPSLVESATVLMGEEKDRIVQSHVSHPLLTLTNVIPLGWHEVSSRSQLIESSVRELSMPEVATWLQWSPPSTVA